MDATAIQSAPVPPIFVYEPGDLIIFNTVLEAESYMEAVDVRNGLYTVYDSIGRLLRLETVATKHSWFKLGVVERVRVGLAESVPAHLEELKKIIVTALEESGVTSSNIIKMTHEQRVAELRRVDHRSRAYRKT